MAISKKVRFEVLKRDNFICTYCGGKSPDVELEIDHKIPKSAGGSDSPTNLVTSCFSCNQGKSDVSLEDDTYLTKDLVERQPRAAAIRPDVKGKLLEDIATLVESISYPKEELEDDVVNTINRILRDHSMRLKIFMIGLTKRHIQNIFDLTQDIEEIEEYLRNRPLSEFSDKDILNMYKEFNNRDKMLRESVMAVSDSGVSNIYEDPQSQEKAMGNIKEKGLSTLNPAKREKLQGLVDNVKKMIQDNLKND